MQSHCLMLCVAWRYRTLRLWLCTVCALWYGDGHTVSCGVGRVRARINLFSLSRMYQSLLSYWTVTMGYGDTRGWYGMVHTHCTTGSLSVQDSHLLPVARSHRHCHTPRCHWYTFSARRLRDSRLSTPHAHRFASQRFTLAHRQLQLIAVTSMIVVFMN